MTQRIFRTHYTAEELLATRKRLGMNQTEFWAPLGVTQSAGSRYESVKQEKQGRTIPAPLAMMVDLFYFTQPHEVQAAIDHRRSLYVKAINNQGRPRSVPM